MSAVNARPTLRSVIGRGHMILALVAVSLASVSLTLLGVLALRVYAEHNLHLIARSINYTVEAAVVFNDSAAATEALSLIASTEEVARAEVFDANGKLLAQWVRPVTGRSCSSRVDWRLFSSQDTPSRSSRVRFQVRRAMVFKRSRSASCMASPPRLHCATKAW